MPLTPMPPPRPALLAIDLTGGAEPGTWQVRVIIETGGREERVAFDFTSEQTARDMLTLAERAPWAVALQAADLARQAEPALAGPTGDATADLAALRYAARRDHPAADPAHRCLTLYRAECSCGAWAGTILPTEMDAMIEHDGHRTRDVPPRMPDCPVCHNELDADRYCATCHAQR